jgi:RNA polymerase sigma factor (sigma-70 family)
MERGTDKNVKVILQDFTLKNVNNRYLCLFQIKCAIISCIFDFFYSLKEKHCRSPPTNQFTKKELIGGKRMKENAKCFIRLKKGIYEEITYKELEEKRKKYSTYRKKKFIPIQGMLIEILPTEYKSFYKEIERNKYIKRQEKNIEIFSYDGLIDKDNKNIDIIEDKVTNIEFQIERKLEMEQLRKALMKLDDNEYKLIRALFFEDKTLREYAKNIGISHVAIQRQKERILEKLRKILKN